MNDTVSNKPQKWGSNYVIYPYFTEDYQEIHMMGDMVGVVWDIQTESDSEVVQDGWKTKTVITSVLRRSERGPYIDFFDIRDSSNGGWYVDEDSPVNGGLHTEEARDLAAQLNNAAVYLASGDYLDPFGFAND